MKRFFIIFVLGIFMAKLQCSIKEDNKLHFPLLTLNHLELVKAKVDGDGVSGGSTPKRPSSSQLLWRNLNKVERIDQESKR